MTTDEVVAAAFRELETVEESIKGRGFEDSFDNETLSFRRAALHLLEAVCDVRKDERKYGSSLEIKFMFSHSQALIDVLRKEQA